MLKIAVFTVMTPDLTPEEVVQELKTNGYDGVEWRVTTVPENRRQEKPSFWGNNLSTLAPNEGKRARTLADSAGLEIPGLGTYVKVGDMAGVETSMRFAQECGAKQIRVSAGDWPNGDKTYAAMFNEARAFLKNVEAMARQYHVKGIIEIHHGSIATSASLAFRLVDGFDPNFIGVLHDAGNMGHEGFENYRLGLELLGPYTAHVHVKNVAYHRPSGGGVWKSDWSPLEDGVVNFDALFTALHGVGYNGWVSMEDFSQHRPTREALRANIAFIRAAIAKAYGGKSKILPATD